MSKANTDPLPTEATLAFARSHLSDDPSRLLLSANRYPEVDMQAAVTQIEGQRTAQRKWPALLRCPDFVYPPHLACEQSSSEATAAYKASLVSPCRRIADLTGGMGIDTFALSAKAEEMHYVEQNESLCTLATHNLEALRQSDLHAGNTTVHHADCLSWLATQPPFDLLLIDPARRNAAGRKVAAFADCSPDILTHLPLLLNSATTLMVKASPMIDIDLAASQLGCATEAHIVAVGGECREVLFLCHAGQSAPPLIHCVNLPAAYPAAPSAAAEPSVCPFTRAAEASAPFSIAPAASRYLHIPSAEVMKAGCFRLISSWFSIPKLAPSTHVYTSDQPLQHFPGRTFEVLQEVKLNRREVQQLLPEGRAHVITRNYPLAADQLQRRLGLREGGDHYLIAATVGGHPCGFLCCLLAPENTENGKNSTI
ncbi:MAG: SAM-dependent methyltransferase [Bacteroidales bacterium]|nr:SAM-dependent methyltransferase [Bacteroidales bacterium]